MQKIVTLFCFLCCSFFSHAVVIIPPAPSVAASGYILLDANTGDVIAEQNADMQLAPASLTKIMTMYVIGQELQAGNIALNDQSLFQKKLGLKTSLIHQRCLLRWALKSVCLI